MSGRYYIRTPEQPSFGPYTFGQVQHMQKACAGTENVLIRNEQQTDWYTFESFQGWLEQGRNGQYFLQADQQEFGPKSFSELQGMWNTGQLNGEILFRQDGSSSWIPLSSVADILEHEVSLPVDNQTATAHLAPPTKTRTRKLDRPRKSSRKPRNKWFNKANGTLILNWLIKAVLIATLIVFAYLLRMMLNS